MIKYFLKNPEWELKRATEGSSGFDLRYSGTDREIGPGVRWLASTGLYLDMPIGMEAQVRSRSGLALNHGVIVLNAPGTIDSDYRGEVGVTLINLSQQPWYMIHGERIAQLVFAPVFGASISGWTRAHDGGAGPIVRVDSPDKLSITDRGAGGHGSTGR